MPLLTTAFATLLLTAPKAPDFPPIVTDKTLYADNDFRGKPAPELLLGDHLAGPKIDLKNLGGKVLLIDFWATWCGPCKAIMPELSKWQTKFAKDLVIVGLSDETPEKVNAYIKDKKFTYSFTLDPKQALSKTLGVKGIPHVMVISSDGIVRWQGFPSDAKDKLDEAKLTQILAANRALAKK